MKFHKIISVILHPIVIPTIGVFLYLLFIPHAIKREHRSYIIGLVFITTYLIPLIILILLKGFRLIKSYQVHSIKERKIPLFLMILLFTILGANLIKFTILRDFGMLFYATSFGLAIVYLFSLFKIKVSLHLLSMGSMIGFFMVMGVEYLSKILPILLLLFLLSGLLASSRLHLKAHTSKEVYIGFFLGVLSQISLYYLL